MRPFVIALSAASLLALPATALAQNDLQPPPPVQPGTPGGPGPADPNAPPGMPQSTPPETTAEKEEKEDSGLGLEWIWANAEVGGSYINMTSFDQSSMGLKKDSSAGPMFGIGAGVRLFFLTLGARVRNHALSAFSLWQLNLEAAFHMRIGRVDPYLAFRGGYDFVGKLDSDSVSVATGSTASDVAVRGFNIGMGAGFDYYFSKLFSLGIDGSADVLFLKRPLRLLRFAPRRHSLLVT
jgi:hypothetical protein